MQDGRKIAAGAAEAAAVQTAAAPTAASAAAGAIAAQHHQEQIVTLFDNFCLAEIALRVVHKSCSDAQQQQ